SSDTSVLSLSLIEALLNETGLDAGQLFRQDIVTLHDELKQIRLVIFDVDGVMTDAGMYYTESGDEFKKFNARDGIAIRRLNKAGFTTGVISHGINRKLIERRCDLLGISKVYAGEEPKINVLSAWCEELGIKLSETAFIGDDINDLSLITEVGFSACPADAVNAVKSRCDLILERSGGNGAIRELVERCFIHLNN
ncbi:MAG: HAD hydrolase family protein, partial [Bacteroidetes bacterium]|nr:HAD hydrolase family protein [Bacteroidota bacterium]